MPVASGVDHVTEFGPFVLIVIGVVRGVGDLKVAEQAQMSTYGSRFGRVCFQLPASRITGIPCVFASRAAASASAGWWPSSSRADALVRSTAALASTPRALCETTVRSPSSALTETALTGGGASRVGSASFRVTPFDDKSSAARRARGCLPSAVDSLTWPPRAAIATAALAAGPPAATSTDRDCSFSPGLGKASTRCIRSTVHKPTATTSVTCSVRWLGRPPRSSRPLPCVGRPLGGLPPRSLSGFWGIPLLRVCPGGGRGPCLLSRTRGACCG